jgi:hypothetical protein
MHGLAVCGACSSWRSQSGPGAVKKKQYLPMLQFPHYQNEQVLGNGSEEAEDNFDARY